MYPETLVRSHNNYTVFKIKLNNIFRKKKGSFVFIKNFNDLENL